MTQHDISRTAATRAMQMAPASDGRAVVTRAGPAAECGLEWQPTAAGGVGRAGPGRAGPGWAGLGRDRPGRAGIGRAGPGSAGPGRAGLGSAGLLLVEKPLPRTGKGLS
ncbi:hypothetical protein Ade02nite_11000 [Paractinoplanes deccanensis]|uniref:Uncharacterized protein n=1 Tax=Paractinoplanes deccanensis TaxID=113561 RepID=A0ABQ3XXI2_9ACTN|nr:hypothetical protein Ade02nite_11000 [Actinoplanes deccanensis]